MLDSQKITRPIDKRTTPERSVPGSTPKTSPFGMALIKKVHGSQQRQYMGQKIYAKKETTGLRMQQNKDQQNNKIQKTATSKNVTTLT
jgi:hypothetical protein